MLGRSQLDDFVNVWSDVILRLEKDLTPEESYELRCLEFEYAVSDLLMSHSGSVYGDVDAVIKTIKPRYYAALDGSVARYKVDIRGKEAEIEKNKHGVWRDFFRAVKSFFDRRFI